MTSAKANKEMSLSDDGRELLTGYGRALTELTASCFASNGVTGFVAGADVLEA